MKKLALAVLTAVTLGSCAEKVELSGAGATFPQPFYNMAFQTFTEKTGTPISYGGIGSGGGIRSLKDGIVDFAGSDAFLSDEEMKEMKEVVHVPTCMGAVVMAYNLPEVKELRLTGEVVGDIYLGKIKNWNDARIQALNEGATLPDKAIVPVFRSDGSGTTFVFSDYMSKASDAWRESLGTGKSLNFPCGIAAKGNPGVAGVITQTDGAVGYLGSEYAFAQNTPVAMMQNPKGEFVKPCAASISAAAQGDIPQDTRAMITNSPAKGAYPISCFTWILVYKNQNYSNRSKQQAEATKNLLTFVIGGEAQAMTEKIHYAPLPASVREKAEQNIRSIVFE